MWTDSLGNKYSKLPAKKETPSAKGTSQKRYGRNKAKCERYRAEGRREANKARRAAQREYWITMRAEKRAAQAA